MPAPATFSTTNATLRQLLGNGLSYRVPRFQRDYSWTEAEWEDVWADLLGTIEGGEGTHYMGYLVLRSEDGREFDLIDGQQRLTTLSVLVLAVLRNLQRLVDKGVEPGPNSRRIQAIRQGYIGYLDPVTLVSRSKLTLNRNSNAYYQNQIVPLGPLPRYGLRAPEESLRKAFEWFDQRVQSRVEQSPADAGAGLAHLVERAADRLFFTVITVTDELNAYKVFETLNARGVRLSATDLLKNYLFSVLDASGRTSQEMANLDDRWEQIVGRLGGESFPDYLRVHWNSRHRMVREGELFRTIRAATPAAQDVFLLLRALEEDLETYAALREPEASDWPRAQKESVRLLRLFNVQQPFALLLAARRTLDHTGFELLLKAAVAISFRYNVIGGLSPGAQERVYDRVKEGLVTGEVRTAAVALRGLAAIYPSDAAFREAFAGHTLNTSQAGNRRIARYLLSRIERQLSAVDLDFESEQLSIEHIFPRSPGGQWDGFAAAPPEIFVDRLGNLTLLEASVNRDLSSGSYDEKRATYAVSPYAITRRVAAENHEWSPDRIRARQEWMARQASQIWRVDALSELAAG